jgi:hypothetical protein
MAVYFVQAGEDGPVKIGFATDVASRLNAMRTSNPEELRLVACFIGTYEDERAMHALFAKYRKRGEWFSVAVLAEMDRVELHPLPQVMAPVVPRTLPESPHLLYRHTLEQCERIREGVRRRFSDPEYRARRVAAGKPGGSEWLKRKAALDRHKAERAARWPELYGARQ